MRISDWNSDVCSSDLTRDTPLLRPFGTSFGTVNGGVKAGVELLLHFGALSKRRFRQCFGFGVPCLGSLPALPVHDDFSFGIGLGGKRQYHGKDHIDSGRVATASIRRAISCSRDKRWRSEEHKSEL